MAFCIGYRLRKIEEYADNYDSENPIQELTSGAKTRESMMEKKPQDTDMRPRDTREPAPEQEEATQTRRSFLKRSTGLLIYVTPLILTFDVDDAESANPGKGRGRGRGRVSPGNTPPPPPGASGGSDAGDDDDDSDWDWGDDDDDDD